jgi:hypothetical protein
VRTPGEHHGLDHLEPLIGEWTMAATPPGGPPWPGGGRVSFEWLESRAFLLERWSVDLAEAPDGVAIIGCDAATGTCYQLYTDDRGVHRVYELSFAAGQWKMWRDADDPFPQRFTGALSGDGQAIEGHWERSPDLGSTWEIDFHLTYTRVG